MNFFSRLPDLLFDLRDGHFQKHEGTMRGFYDESFRSKSRTILDRTEF
jgi:hypothetical protein